MGQVGNFYSDDLVCLLWIWVCLMYVGGDIERGFSGEVLEARYDTQLIIDTLKRSLSACLKPSISHKSTDIKDIRDSSTLKGRPQIHPPCILSQRIGSDTTADSEPSSTPK